jgi:hypothetical protein
MDKQSNSTPAFKSLGELTENIVRRLSASGTQTLQGTIYRYRGELNLYLAASHEAENRGDLEDIPFNYGETIGALTKWDKPAESWEAAKMALELALEDYEMGDTPRIPAMIKAALGWIDSERKRRASA